MVSLYPPVKLTWFWKIAHLQIIYLPKMEVSSNGGTAKSSMLMVFSLVNHPFLSTQMVIFCSYGTRGPPGQYLGLH